MTDPIGLPWWLRQWAAEYLDADGPPPTPEPEQIRALIDRLGLVRALPEPAVTRSRLIDRIRAAIGRWR